jgi:WD40 repeat protein
MITTVAFAGEDVVLAGGIDRSIQLWRLHETGPEAVARLVAHDEAVFAADFSPDETLLAVSSYDGSTTLWDSTDPGQPRQLTRLANHRRGIRAEAFDPDGRLLATAGDDGTVAITGVVDRHEPALLDRVEVVQVPVNPRASEADNGVLAVTFSGSVLIVGAADGRTLLYDVSGLQSVVRTPREAACERTVTGLGPDDWAKTLPGVNYRRTCD